MWVLLLEGFNLRYLIIRHHDKQNILSGQAIFSTFDRGKFLKTRLTPGIPKI